MANFGKIILIVAVVFVVGAIFAISAKTIAAQKETVSESQNAEQVNVLPGCSAGGCSAGTCGCGGNCAAARTGSCGCGIDID